MTNLTINIDEDNSTYQRLKIISIFFIRLILMIIAGYLSLNCNQNINIILRILFMIVSVMFSELYILYYTIYRIILGNKCFV